MAGAMRAVSMAGAMRIHQSAPMSQPDDTAQKPSSALPGWLRQTYVTTIDAARADIVRQAQHGMKGHGEVDAGIIADRQIKAILATAGDRTPSEATAAAYRRDHANMLAANTTPAEKATTFQHFNRLRSAWKFGELEAIRALRHESEVARKAKDYVRMLAATVAAYERAFLLDAMFLASPTAPSRQTWGRKAAALRAAGLGKNAGKSKRAAGRVAPTPDQLLVLLSQQRQRCVRVEVAAAVFACFGVRPAELCAGARLYLDGEALGLEVYGAKVDATRGQKVRYLVISPERVGCSGLAVAFLRGEVSASRVRVALTSADLAAVRRAMRAAQPGLSPYAYRHARASDAKAGHGRAGVAAWLGHRTDRAQSGYGNARSSTGAVRIKSANASRIVRRVKSLPGQQRPRGFAPAPPSPTLALSVTPARPRSGPRLR